MSKFKRFIATACAATLSVLAIAQSARAYDIVQIDGQLVEMRPTWVVQGQPPVTPQAPVAVQPQIPAQYHSIPQVSLVRVSLAEKSATLYKAGVPIKTYQVGIGAPDTPTPRGSFQIDEMEKDPFYFTQSGQEIPPGPNNPLGSRWLRFTSRSEGDYGFHAGSVGTASSLGCIHLADGDLEDFYAQVEVGTQVDVF